jgi:hypothetical protein
VKEVIVRDPLKASPYETDRPEFVGVGLKTAKKQIRAAKLDPYVIWTDGEWDPAVRVSILRPNEVNLVVKDGVVQRAYQIL